jgi:protein phosphatase
VSVGCGETNTGAVRANNEDAFLVENAPFGVLPNLFAVADGMGGHNAGEIASAEALKAFHAYARDYRGTFRYTQDMLAECAKAANREVYRRSQEDAALSGMGTTLSACCVDDKNIYYAHVGDSRVYIVSNGTLRPITQDHSLVAELVRSGDLTEDEAREHPHRNIMTRALGTDKDVFIDSGYMPIDGAERILICSDGLTGMLSDSEIAGIIFEGGGRGETVRRLIDRAIEKGGYDNVTVVLADIG